MERHRQLGNLRMAGEGRLHLAELDAKAAQLDLMIEAAEKVDLARLGPPHQIAGAVEALPWLAASRVGDETFGGQARAHQVAACELKAADHELSGNSDGHRPQTRIHDLEAGARDRPADHHLGAGSDAARRHPHRRLGGSVEVSIRLHRRRAGARQDRPRGPRRRRGSVPRPRAANQTPRAGSRKRGWPASPSLSRRQGGWRGPCRPRSPRRSPSPRWRRPGGAETAPGGKYRRTEWSPPTIGPSDRALAAGPWFAGSRRSPRGGSPHLWDGRWSRRYR